MLNFLLWCGDWGFPLPIPLILQSFASEFPLIIDDFIVFDSIDRLMHDVGSTRGLRSINIWRTTDILPLSG